MTQPPVAEAAGFNADYAAEQMVRSRNPLRRWVKGFYLRSVLSLVQGPTIDYGCGAGQLLARLPPGSVGLEVNPHLIAGHQKAGLSVRQWQPNDQGFDLPGLETDHYKTLVISHVLEHLPDPNAALTRLLQACARLGVQRLIVIVPGAKGFASDATHRSFIDSAYVDSHGWQRLAGFALRRQRFFPLPWEAGGAIYIYNEMQLVFDRLPLAGT
jgi:SAM-dependent methyltransferase